MMTSSNGNILRVTGHLYGEFTGLNKRLSKQSWGWWFETLSRPLWHHCNVRDRCRLHQLQFHTYTYGFRSCKYSGSKRWNSLPRAIKNTNDINEFNKKYFRVVSDLWSLQTGDILMSFSISNSSNYNVSLCHIYGRRILTMSVYVIFQLCLKCLTMLRCYPLIGVFHSYMYVYVFNLDFCVYSICTWILHSYER